MAMSSSALATFSNHEPPVRSAMVRRICGAGIPSAMQKMAIFELSLTTTLHGSRAQHAKLNAPSYTSTPFQRSTTTNTNLVEKRGIRGTAHTGDNT